MAESGRIIVEGAINGASAQPDTVSALVLPRARSGKQPQRPSAPVLVEGGGDLFLPIHPKREGDLGETRIGNFVEGDSLWTTIESGPNTDFRYVRKMYWVAVTVFVNKPAMTSGSDWVNLHPTTSGTQYCTQSVATNFLYTARQHEGSNWELVSHSGLFWETLVGLNTGPIVEQMSSFLAPPAGPISGKLLRERRQAMKAAAHADEGGLMPLINLPNGCVFHWYTQP